MAGEDFEHLKAALLSASRQATIADRPFVSPGGGRIILRSGGRIRAGGNIDILLGQRQQTTDAPLNSVPEAAARAAYRANRPDWLAFEALPKLRENLAEDAPKLVYARLLQTLYFGEKDEIAPAIEAARKTLDRTDSPYDAQRVWSHIQEIANQVRKLGVDFSKIPKFEATSASKR